MKRHHLQQWEGVNVFALLATAVPIYRVCIPTKINFQVKCLLFFSLSHYICPCFTIILCDFNCIKIYGLLV